MTKYQYDTFEIDDISCDCSTEELIEEIKKAEKKALSVGGKDLRWALSTWGCYDTDYGRLELRFTRPYTQAELEQEKRYLKDQERREKAQYEALKKKFENKS